MQQSSIQNCNKRKDFVTRVGIALGIASVIAMAPMSNAMATTYYSDYFKTTDQAAYSSWANKLGTKAADYCANRKKTVTIDNVTSHWDPKNHGKKKLIVDFSCHTKGKNR